MRRVLPDSNALDPLLTQGGAWILGQAVKSAKMAILFTHVAIDEIAAIPDRGERQRLLKPLLPPPSVARYVPVRGARELPRGREGTGAGNHELRLAVHICWSAAFLARAGREA